MTKSIIAGCSAAAILVVASCTSGSSDIIAPPATKMAVADAGVPLGDSGSADETDGGDGAIPADGAIDHPPACGSFVIGPGALYTSGELHGAPWIAINSGSSISPTKLIGLPAGTPYCVQGTVVQGTGNAFAILGLYTNGIVRNVAPAAAGPGGVASDAGTLAPIADSVVPTSDGLLVNIANVANSTLWVCLIDTEGTQWCLTYTGQAFLPWASFRNNFGNGSPYDRRAISSIDVTVPSPGASAMSPFHFCINSIVEASSQCGCDGGACTCALGETLCGGVCSATYTDPDSCGSCGNACGALSACAAAQCSAPLTTVSSDPFALAVDSTNAYFTNYNGAAVMKAPVDGGAAVTIAAGQPGPDAIAVDEVSLYWTNGGSQANGFADGAVMRMALAGDASGPEALTTDTLSPSAIALDSSNIYWTSVGSSAKNYLDGTVSKIALAAPNTRILIASGQANPTAIAVDSGNVYWTNAGTSTNSYTDGTVMTAPLGDGGAPLTLARAQLGPRSIAVDATHVYWTSEDGTVMKVPILPGGAVTTFARDQANPFRLAISGANVYWANLRGGQIMKEAASGGTPAVVAAAYGFPYGIATSGVNVYWTIQDGTSSGGILRSPL